jgi:hypothetical protein
MPTQDSYSERHAAGFPGMIASTIPNTLISVNVEESAGIAFGKPVVKGTGDRDGKVPDANGENNFLGVSVREISTRYSAAADADKFPQYTEARLMTKGDIWVSPGENVTAGEDVFFVEATAVWMGGTASTNQKAINAKWLDTTSNGGLGRIRLY